MPYNGFTSKPLVNFIYRLVTFRQKNIIHLICRKLEDMRHAYLLPVRKSHTALFLVLIRRDGYAQIFGHIFLGILLPFLLLHDIMVTKSVTLVKEIIMAERSRDKFEAFRKNLKALINNRGMNQADMASELGMSTAALSRYLNGVRSPNLEYVIKIANYFDISVDWLLGLTGERYNVMPADLQEVAWLYSLATKDDQNVVQAVLAKYREAAKTDAPDDNHED